MATAIAKGIHKELRIGKQTGIGVPKTGAGGFKLRRRADSVFTATRSTTETNELTSHRMSTGLTYGEKQSGATINTQLSPTTYELLFADLCRKDFAATSDVTSLSITIAGSGPTYTVTRAAGSWLTDGIKAGDVVRLTAGSFTTINLNNNLLVISETATVLTVQPLNGDTLVAEGPIAASTLAVPGQKTLAPLTSHTNDFFTFEEWHTEQSLSEVFPDCKVNTANVSIPAEGGVTTAFNIVGLGVRTRDTSESFTTPTTETSTPIVQAISGLVFVNGVSTGCVTSASITMDKGIASTGATIGSAESCDMTESSLKVSGTMSIQFANDTIQDLYDAETRVSVVLVAAADTTKDSEFMTFSLPRVAFTDDAPDGGEVAITRTYPFTAEKNTTGGAALEWDDTIISIQDSEL